MCIVCIEFELEVVVTAHLKPETYHITGITRKLMNQGSSAVAPSKT